MKRKAWIAAIAAALVSTAAVAHWGSGPGGNGPGAGYGPGMMMGAGNPGGGCFGPGGMQSLDLTTEQRDRIAAIYQEGAADRTALMDAMHAERAKGTYDAPAMNALRERMFALNQAQREKIEAVLTPEQRERLNKGAGRFAWHR